MNFRIYPLLVLLLIMGCNTRRESAPGMTDLIPANSFAVVKINNLTAFKSDLKNNDFLNAFENSEAYTRLSRNLQAMKYLQSNARALLAFTRETNDSTEFLLIVPDLPDLFSVEDATNLTEETLTAGTQNFEKYTLDGTAFYSMLFQNYRLLSSSTSVLQQVEENTQPDAVLQSLFDLAGPEKNATAFLKLTALGEVLTPYLQETANETLKGFSDWVTLDLSSRQDYLGLNGVSTEQDTVPGYSGLFKNISPLPLLTPTMAPESTQTLLTFAFDDYRTFSENRRKHRKTPLPADSLFNTAEEISLARNAEETFFYVKTYGGETLTEYLNAHVTETTEHRGTQIYTLAGDSLLTACFQPLVGDFETGAYTILENTFVFSTNPESLGHMLNQYQTGATLDKTVRFQDAREALPDEANILLLTNQDGLAELLEDSMSSEMLKDLRSAKLSDYTFAAQLVSEGDFYYVSLLAQQLSPDRGDRDVSRRFTVQLDAPIASEPQLVINHRTRNKEIVVQDEDNNLYLISTEGKVLWKKPLTGRVRGKISQVDLYKNGKLQLAFTTDNQLLVVDRNGETVQPFDKTFPGGNLNPLAVFDYENNRNYRFVVTQGTKVFMYNNRAQVVTGFTYTEAESPILTAPQHFRIGNRDYLVFKLEGGELKILNRVGKTRVPVSEKIDFSDNEVYVYKNQFALTDRSGTLYMINEKGEVTKTPFNLNQDHGMDATSKSLAYMDDNILSIKGNEAQLDYGVYTAPRIFYIYDKIYVSVTDLQGYKTYLYDSSAEPIPGFPVSGSSAADLGDMNNDGALELVVQEDERSLVVYHLHR